MHAHIHRGVWLTPWGEAAPSACNPICVTVLCPARWLTPWDWVTANPPDASLSVCLPLYSISYFSLPAYLIVHPPSPLPLSLSLSLPLSLPLIFLTMVSKAQREKITSGRDYSHKLRDRRGGCEEWGWMQRTGSEGSLIASLQLSELSITSPVWRVITHPTWASCTSCLAECVCVRVCVCVCFQVTSISWQLLFLVLNKTSHHLGEKRERQKADGTGGWSSPSADDESADEDDEEDHTAHHRHQ